MWRRVVWYIVTSSYPDDELWVADCPSACSNHLSSGQRGLRRSSRTVLRSSRADSVRFSSWLWCLKYWLQSYMPIDDFVSFRTVCVCVCVQRYVTRNYLSPTIFFAYIFGSFKNTEVPNTLQRFGSASGNLWSRVQHVLQWLGTKRHFPTRLAIL
jgi:hypothetical protein